MLIRKAHKDLKLSCGCQAKEGDSLVLFEKDWKTTCPKHAILYLYGKIKDMKLLLKDIKCHT